MMRWCWVNFQCRGGLLIWIIVWQGPAASAVGAGEKYLDIFSLIYYFFSLSLSLGGGLILTVILSQRAVNPKTAYHPSAFLLIFKAFFFFLKKKISLLKTYFSLAPKQLFL